MRMYFSERIREAECGCHYDAFTNAITAFCATHYEDWAREELARREELEWAQDVPEVEEEDKLPW